MSPGADVLGLGLEVLGRVAVVDAPLVHVQDDRLADQPADVDAREVGAVANGVDRRVHVRAEVVEDRELRDAAVLLRPVHDVLDVDLVEDRAADVPEQGDRRLLGQRAG